MLTTVLQTPRQRREVAREVCKKLATSVGPVTFVLPVKGGHCWDLPGGPLYDAEGLEAFCDEMRKACPENVRLVELNAHINDPVFADTVLAQFDDWVARGLLAR